MVLMASHGDVWECLIEQRYTARSRPSGLVKESWAGQRGRHPVSIGPINWALLSYPLKVWQQSCFLALYKTCWFAAMIEKELPEQRRRLSLTNRVPRRSVA